MIWQKKSLNLNNTTTELIKIKKAPDNSGAISKKHKNAFPPCFKTKIAKNFTQQSYFFRMDPARTPESIGTSGPHHLQILQFLWAPGM